jgi:hypothetical protein
MVEGEKKLQNGQSPSVQQVDEASCSWREPAFADHEPER